MKPWGWLLQYGVAILLSLLLGAVLGSLPLFKEASVGSTRLTASRLVQFLGYGSGLLLLWLLGQRAALALPDRGKGPSALRHLIVPLATLIVTAAGYQVVLLIGGPFLGTTGKTIYNWLFVVGIVGAALWLILAWFWKVAPLMESWEGLGRKGPSTEKQLSLRCPQCHNLVPVGMKYCGHCGVSLG
jgi:hypothetical protein